MRSLASVTIDGTTLAVSVSGDIRPSSEAQFELKVLAGPIPAAVRIWIGDEAAVGALKVKAGGHSDHFHGETEAQADLTNATLWIEIETSIGIRTIESINLG